MNKVLLVARMAMVRQCLPGMRETNRQLKRTCNRLLPA
jgi:hypothetical protein